mmetsp:Transcript_9854/g.30417  ORF Transcript_9854/g.30417 Transcript_9854/m.30417 type:complete len:271 (+) Transcript_9854:371-1183(+)
MPEVTTGEDGGDCRRYHQRVFRRQPSVRSPRPRPPAAAVRAGERGEFERSRRVEVGRRSLDYGVRDQRAAARPRSGHRRGDRRRVGFGDVRGVRRDPQRQRRLLPLCGRRLRRRPPRGSNPNVLAAALLRAAEYSRLDVRPGHRRDPRALPPALPPRHVPRVRHRRFGRRGRLGSGRAAPRTEPEQVDLARRARAWGTAYRRRVGRAGSRARSACGLVHARRPGGAHQRGRGDDARPGWDSAPAVYDASGDSGRPLARVPCPVPSMASGE